MEQSTEVFVGIDVAKARNAVAVADGERNGEVRCNGCGRDVGFPTPPAQIRTCGTTAYGSCLES